MNLNLICLPFYLRSFFNILVTLKLNFSSKFSNKIGYPYSKQFYILF